MSSIELVRGQEREWVSKCEAVKGTMNEISMKINYINAQPHSFVIATHQPIKVTRPQNTNHDCLYETIIFYKYKIIKESGENEVTKRGLQ